MDQILAHWNSICSIFKRSLSSAHRSSLSSYLTKIGRNWTVSYWDWCVQITGVTRTHFPFPDFFVLVPFCIPKRAIFCWPIKAADLHWQIQLGLDKMLRTNPIFSAVNDLDGDTVMYLLWPPSEWIRHPLFYRYNLLPTPQPQPHNQCSRCLIVVKAN